MEKREEDILLTLPHIAWHDITIKNLIGHGSYGEVYQAVWHEQLIAVKQLQLQKMSEMLKRDFMHETSIMAQCQHPHVLPLKGICVEEGHYAMLLEYMPKGSLYDVLQNQAEHLPWENLRWEIAIGIGKGLAYLHEKHIVHRDLKSLNVLLDLAYQPKIGDFGLSKIKLESGSTRTKTRGIIGTTRWMAPELFDEDNPPAPTTASDIYSYGMVLWEIAARVLPFKNIQQEMQVMFAIAKGKQEKIPDDCPLVYKEAIQDCWKRISSDRPITSHIVKKLEEGYKKLPLWYFDAHIKAKTSSKEDSYQLISAPDTDRQKVLQFYHHCSVPGYDIASIDIIYHPERNRTFSLALSNLQRRYNNPTFLPQWHKELNAVWRGKVNSVYEIMAAPYADSAYPAVKLVPVWHGTDDRKLKSLCQTGYAKVSFKDKTDAGFFGGGFYFTYEPEYAYRVYGQVLILNWVAVFSAYPVIEGDREKLEGKTNYENYDAHFVLVSPQHPTFPNEKVYIPTPLHQRYTYTELVVFESAACLPRYVVKLSKQLAPDNQLWAPPENALLAALDSMGFWSKPSHPETLTHLSAPAAYALGRLLLIQSNPKDALAYLIQAANKDYPSAYLLLGFLYHDALLPAVKDVFLAATYFDKVKLHIDWFQTEAQMGSADAQNNLGICYYYGIGVKRDYREAVYWYQRAAHQKDASGQYNLAVCYEKGKGVKASALLALDYYQRAINQGSVVAQFALGALYESNKTSGITQDLEKAYYHYEMAAKAGHEEAKKKLNQMEIEIKPEDTAHCILQ